LTRTGGLLMMDMMSEKRLSPNASPPRGLQQVVPREELCGALVGNRRVRLQRPPRSVGRRVVSIVRRTLSR
jgi:hypothetical protein